MLLKWNPAHNMFKRYGVTDSFMSRNWGDCMRGDFEVHKEASKRGENFVFREKKR